MASLEVAPNASRSEHTGALEVLQRGRLQRSGGTINVIADELQSLLPLAHRLSADADMHGSLPGIHSFH